MNAHGIVIEQHMFTLNGYHMKVNNIGGGDIKLSFTGMINSHTPCTH